MKKKSNVLVLIVAFLLLIISVALMFLYDISPLNMRFADCYTSDYYMSKTSPCTSYKYEVNGDSYNLNACGYSSTDYITKKHTVVYDLNNPNKAYLLTSIIIIIGMFVLSIVLFLYRFILIFKKLNIHDKIVPIMPILIYLVLLSIAIFLFRNTYISKRNQVSVRSYVVDLVQTTSISSDDSFTKEVDTYAIVNYELDNKQYKRVVANVKSSAKIGDYADLTVSKKNPYRAVASHEQIFSIIYLGLLVIIGSYIFIAFTYYKVTGKVLLG